MFKKVVITGDTRRPISEQKDNIQKLARLISLPIQLASEEIPIVIDSQKDKSKDQYTWANEWTYSAQDYAITRVDLKKTLVIGFELPKSVKDYLMGNRVSFIDIRISPIRFCKDLLFCYHDYQVKGLKRIPRYLNEVTLNIESDIKQFKQYPESFKYPTTLIVGQSQFDSSIIDKGKFIKLEYTPEPTERVVFKPHPLDQSMKLNFEETHIPIYQLLACKNVTKVVGISSSALCEAILFNKKVEVQHPSPWWNGYKLMLGSKEITALDFWLSVFNRPDKSVLRKYYNTWWGYPKA